MNKLNFIISPEITLALKLSQPIVALESIIITHGLQYPFIKGFTKFGLRVIYARKYSKQIEILQFCKKMRDLNSPAQLR